MCSWIQLFIKKRQLMLNVTKTAILKGYIYLLPYCHSFHDITQRFILSKATTGGVLGGVLGNFAKLTGKHLCTWVSFFPQACNFIKKRLWHRCFPVNFVKILRTHLLQNTFGRLLLIFSLWPFQFSEFLEIWHFRYNMEFHLYILKDCFVGSFWDFHKLALTILNTVF